MHIMAPLKRLGRGEQGQAIIEMALTLPLLLLIVLGVFDFGLMFRAIRSRHECRAGGRAPWRADVAVHHRRGPAARAGLPGRGRNPGRRLQCRNRRERLCDGRARHNDHHRDIACGERQRSGGHGAIRPSARVRRTNRGIVRRKPGHHTCSSP